MIKNELDLYDGDFNEIKIENVGNVFLSKGNRNSIVLERNSENDKNIDFKIMNGIVSIKPLHAIEENKRNNNYNVYVTFKNENISIHTLNIGSFQTENKV